MQNEITNSTPANTDTASTVPATTTETVAPVATSTVPAVSTSPATVKPTASGKRLANVTRPAAKAAKPVKLAAVKKPSAKIKAAKPAATDAKTAAKQAVSTDRAEARLAARNAVAEFYAGISKPFKSAADLPYKADLNPSLQRSPTERTAGLIAAILTYCDVQPDGSFVRGSGNVPGSLIGKTGADAHKLYRAGPESGCTSNMLGQQITFVSGSHGGKLAADAVLRLTDKAISNLINFNVSPGNGKPKRFSAVLKLARDTLDAKRFPSLAANVATATPAAKA